eukprot:566152-Amphidinium_carterae.1
MKLHDKKSGDSHLCSAGTHGARTRHLMTELRHCAQWYGGQPQKWSAHSAPVKLCFETVCSYPEFGQAYRGES